MPNGHGEELARVSSGGKTFFFNKVPTKGGDRHYLRINAIWGQGNMERLVVFKSHLLEFRDAFFTAFEEMTGLPAAKLETPEPEWPSLPAECPGCKTDSINYRVIVEDGWSVICNECQRLILAVGGDNG